MSYQGKYSQKKTRKPASKGKKIVLILVIVLVVLIAAIAIAAVIYMNSMLSLMTKPTENTYETLSQAEIDAILNPESTTQATEAAEVTETTVETSPEDTWPVIESDENLTHIMLVGQAARAGEEYKLADSMILCTINRETKTLTMTSFMRDLYVTIPAYWGNGQGGNRMNVVYHLGYYYGGDGMEMLELCIEQNFGIQVDHTVEINFEIFETIVDLMGGVEVELSEAELGYMQYNGNNPELQLGMNILNGTQALDYARMRKIDSDFERTRRQKEVITSLINSCRNLGIMDIHAMFTEVLPMIKTNMTNEEITNYAFEFIPMLKDLQIESINIPEDVSWWSHNLGTEEAPNYVLKCDMWAANKLLREKLGIIEEETE